LCLGVAAGSSWQTASTATEESINDAIKRLHNIAAFDANEVIWAAGELVSASTTFERFNILFLFSIQISVTL